MRVLVIFFLVTISTVAVAQTSVEEETQRQEALEREALMRKREAMIKSFEADPEKYRDSVRAVRRKASQVEAKKRLAIYAENQRKDTVKVLDLSYAQLSAIPELVFEFDSLEKLILDQNSINKLPRKLKKLKKLDDIRWNENDFSGKVKIARGLPVKRLQVNSGEISKMPPVKRLMQLEYLEMSSNEITDFPLKQLKASSKLREVVMKENPFGDLEEMRFDKWESVEILKLNKCDISDIHPSFYSIPKLKELQLQENPLRLIPEGISSMKALGKISFYKCNLEKLPDDFFKIPELVIADLYYNQLKSIPTSIGNAENIEVLFLSHNQIIEIPEEIGELTTLQQLYLHNNRISYLPESLVNLSQLNVLRVNNNLLQQFPNQIVSLTGLTDLDVDDNMIEYVPAAIGQLSNLKLFTFDGNPINFNDPANKTFMEEVSKLEASGTICKPSIKMNYLDQNGAKVDM